MRPNIAADGSTQTHGRKLKARENENELEKQISPRDTHGCGYALAYFRDSKRRVVSARRTGGAVSSNCRGVGDLRLALREAEVGTRR